MNQDWKDILSGLKGGLPEGEKDETTTSEKGKDSLIQKSALTVVSDKKGRNGKTATIIEGFEIAQEKVEKIAKSLKTTLGVGGSTRDGEILVQGDHKAKVIEVLKKMNFKVKG